MPRDPEPNPDEAPSKLKPILDRITRGDAEGLGSLLDAFGELGERAAALLPVLREEAEKWDVRFVGLLFDEAVKGRPLAQDLVYKIIEPRARRVAEQAIGKWGVGGRVRATEVIDQLFEEFILSPVKDPACPPPPNPSTAAPVGDESRQAQRETDRANRWRNRAYFYACVGRRSRQIVADLLKGERGIRDWRPLVDILTTATEEPEFQKRLAEVWEDDVRVEQLVGGRGLASSDQVYQKIMALGADPSRVAESVRSILKKAWPAARVGASPEQGPAIVRGLLASPEAKRCLTLTRRSNSLDAEDSATDGPPLAVDEALGGGFHDLTINSLLTLHEALDRMDDYFAGDQKDTETVAARATPAVLVGTKTNPLHSNLEPLLPIEVERIRPRSLHGQIVHLRLIGWSYEEIAEGVGKPLATVNRWFKTAIVWLRGDLGDALRSFGRDLDPPPK